MRRRTTEMIGQLWHRLSAKRQRQFLLLIALMLLASAAEIVSLGMIFPFLAVLTSPGSVLDNPPVAVIAGLLGIQSPEKLVIAAALAFCVAAIFAGGVRLALLYVNTRYSFALGADLSAEVYRRTLYQPYIVHVARNSSEVINGIVGKTAMVVGSILVPVLNLISASILIVGIVGALIAVDPAVALGAAAVFGVVYGLIMVVTRSQLRRDSVVVAEESTRVIKALQEGLGGIRDVLLDGTQEEYLRIFQASDRPLRLAQARTTFISGSPRYFVETLGMVLIALLAIAVLQRQGGAASAIPLLGVLALGAQRLLPIFQQAYTAVTTIRGAEATLGDIIELLDQPLSDVSSPTPTLPFSSDISLASVSFSYERDGAAVLSDVSVSIKKGTKVGFIGRTGSGKSTLLDVTMGLLAPTRGALLVDATVVTQDNRHAWQAHIAHVPQSIYLSDATVAENIAFGIPKEAINGARVAEAARKAQIASSIEGWPKAYDTIVGERGAKLSGGQRQRIGVARALYKRADVIVFDEATSALDGETEEALMEAIQAIGDNITVLIVAHRLTTLRGCDLIVELRDGTVFRTGSYADLIAGK